jgi:hypothetical protein
MYQDSNPLASCSNKRNLLLPTEFYPTLFLMCAYDYRQHTTSPSFTYSTTINTQLQHMAFHFTSSCLPLSQTKIINDRIRTHWYWKGNRIEHRQPIHGTITHGSEFSFEVSGHTLLHQEFRFLIKINYAGNLRWLHPLIHRTMRSGEFCKGCA